MAKRTNTELLTTFLIRESRMDARSWVGPSPVAVPIYRQEMAREDTEKFSNIHALNP